MKLPRGEHALIDHQKLTSYSLDAGHDEGRHKAHLFQSLLGIDLGNVEILFQALENIAVEGEIELGKLDQYGQRYINDFDFIGPGGKARIRSVWIIRHDEDFPRLVTCYIL
jgi:hypothetical protein